MKRWISALLALVLCLTLPALAENAEMTMPPTPSVPPETGFGDSLREWAGRLDPSAGDIEALFAMNGETWSALLRSDEGLTQIAVPGLGTLQFGGTTVALEYAGQTYAVDLEPLLRLLEEVQASFEPVSEEDLALIAGLLQRCAREVIMPFVTPASFSDGISLHIDVDGDALTERLYAFVDEVLEDEAFGRLYDRYGGYMGMCVPGFPGSLAELKTLWSEGAQSRARPGYLSRFSLEADVQMTFSGDREFAFAGDVRYAGGYMDFSAEYKESYEGFSAGASLNGYDARSYHTFDYTFSLDAYDGVLSGSLLTGGFAPAAYTLKADVTDGIDAEFTCSRGGETEWSTWFYAWEDIDAQTVTGEIYYTDYGSEAPETQTLASLSVRYWDSGCSGTLELPEASLNARMVTGTGYIHTTADVRTTDGAKSSADVWLFRKGWSGYRMRVNLSQSMRGRPFDQRVVTAEVDDEGLFFKVSDPLRGASTEGSVAYRRMYNGYDFSLYYLDDDPYIRAMLGREKRPLSFHAAYDGEKYTVEAEYSGDYRRFGYRDGVQTFKAEYALDDTGAPAWLEGEYVSSMSVASYDSTTTRHVSFVPGKLTVTVTDTLAGQNGSSESAEKSWTVTLEKVSETERELTYRLSSDTSDEVYDLNVELDEDLTTLSARVTTQGITIAEASVAVKDKTPIVPLDTEGAVMIDAGFIARLILGQMGLVDESAAFDDAPAAEARAEVEAAAEAVEEAAEDVGEAVEEAAEAVIEAVP